MRKTIKIDELKQLLSDSGEEVENKYFIRSLTQALNTISKKTNISATCSVNKDGRSIRSVEFKIINKYKPEVSIRYGKTGIQQIIEKNKEKDKIIAEKDFEIKRKDQQIENLTDENICLYEENKDLHNKLEKKVCTE